MQPLLILGDTDILSLEEMNPWKFEVGCTHLPPLNDGQAQCSPKWGYNGKRRRGAMDNTGAGEGGWPPKGKGRGFMAMIRPGRSTVGAA